MWQTQLLRQCSRSGRPTSVDAPKASTGSQVYHPNPRLPGNRRTESTDGELNRPALPAHVFARVCPVCTDLRRQAQCQRRILRKCRQTNAHGERRAVRSPWASGVAQQQVTSLGFRSLFDRRAQSAAHRRACGLHQSAASLHLLRLALRVLRPSLAYPGPEGSFLLRPP